MFGMFRSTKLKYRADEILRVLCKIDRSDKVIFLAFYKYAGTVTKYGGNEYDLAALGLICWLMDPCEDNGISGPKDCETCKQRLEECETVLESLIEKGTLPLVGNLWSKHRPGLLEATGR